MCSGEIDLDGGTGICVFALVRNAVKSPSSTFHSLLLQVTLVTFWSLQARPAVAALALSPSPLHLPVLPEDRWH